jgi:hypothetical protein
VTYGRRVFILAASDLADTAAVVAAVLALVGVLGPARAWFNRTVGRRFDLYRRFERLGVGAHHSFFETVIGEGPAIRRSVAVELPDWARDEEPLEGDEYVPPPLVQHEFVEALWVDPLFYAQTLSDEDGTVVGFSVTTRVRRFAPRFAAPRPVPTRVWLIERLTAGRRQVRALAHVRLGRTRFSDVLRTDWGPPKVRSLVGARYFAYSEAWSFGNPGHYSDYVCSTNMASRVGDIPTHLESLDWPENREDPEEGYAPSGPDEDPRLAPWIEDTRRAAVVTTWSVIKFPLSPETWPVSFGPHGDEVRTLP